MNHYDESDFVCRVPNLTKVSGGAYVLECPYCKEGKSKGFKKRGYILPGSSSRQFITFYCQNCGKSTSFKKFLQELFPDIFEEYKAKEKTLWLDKLKNNEVGRKRKVSEQPVLKDRPDYIKLHKDLIPVVEHQPSLDYLLGRKIPQKAIEKIFYANSYLSERGDLVPYRDCIIFPFYDGNEVYGFQARSYKSKYFHTVVQAGWKIYDLFNIDLNRPVFIIESIIDSMFVPNSISSLGADISEELLAKIKKPIFIFDNDETGITKSIKYSNMGYKVFVWPEDVVVKDINKGITDGVFTRKEFLCLIKNNVYSGFQAKVKLGLK